MLLLLMLLPSPLFPTLPRLLLPIAVAVIVVGIGMAPRHGVESER